MCNVFSILARTTRVEHVGLSVHGEKKSLEDLITQLKAVFCYLQTNWFAFGKKIAIHYKLVCNFNLLLIVFGRTFCQLLLGWCEREQYIKKTSFQRCPIVCWLGCKGSKQSLQNKSDFRNQTDLSTLQIPLTYTYIYIFYYFLMIEWQKYY